MHSGENSTTCCDVSNIELQSFFQKKGTQVAPSYQTACAREDKTRSAFDNSTWTFRQLTQKPTWLDFTPITGEEMVRKESDKMFCTSLHHVVEMAKIWTYWPLLHSFSNCSGGGMWRQWSAEPFIYNPFSDVTGRDGKFEIDVSASNWMIHDMYKSTSMSTYIRTFALYSIEDCENRLHFLKFNISIFNSTADP